MLTIAHETAGLRPLDIYRSKIADKPEIIEAEIAPGVVCFSVMKGIGSADTYDTLWSREARGITFSANSGLIISRPFHKFFNVNEREETQIGKLDWKRVTRVMDKRDGSMIHPVIVNGQVRFKSKKTLESDVAVAAEKFMRNFGGNYYSLCEYLLTHYNATPIFEWTCPQHRIVLGYDEPELKLMHVRYNESGRYMTLAEIHALVDHESLNVPMVDEVTEFNSFEEMLDAAKTREHTEGWVVQFDDGEMVKVKTEWYMKRHRAMTFFRERDIVVLAMDEELDDVKAMLAGDGVDIAQIEEVEQRYLNDMRQLVDSVQTKYETVKHLEARYAAAAMKSDPHFGLVMNLFNKKTPKYLDYFRQNLLKQNYGLQTMGSLMGFKGSEENDG